MIDLHTHTLFSDGVLVPSELVRRAVMKGYEVIALTDHADASILDFIIPRLATACRELNARWKITAPAGHRAHAHTAGDLRGAREQGPVPGRGRRGGPRRNARGARASRHEPGGHRARVDILAHPGLITKDEAERAAKNGVCLEITTRKGHSLSNGHVAQMAGQTGGQARDRYGHPRAGRPGHRRVRPERTPRCGLERRARRRGVQEFKRFGGAGNRCLAQVERFYSALRIPKSAFNEGGFIHAEDQEKAYAAKRRPEEEMRSIAHHVAEFVAPRRKQALIAASVVLSLIIAFSAYALVQSSRDKKASQLLPAALEYYSPAKGIPPDYGKALNSTATSAANIPAR